MRRHLDDHPNLTTSAFTTLPVTVSPIVQQAKIHQAGLLSCITEGLQHIVASTPQPKESEVTTVREDPSSTNSATTASSPKPTFQRQALALLQETFQSAMLQESREMQSGGVQFSVQTNYQSRVGSGPLNQGGHSANTTIHHALPVQTQAHQQQALHQTQAHSQATQMQGQQQQQQFQRLKVEDALSYLDQVKFKFGNQPQVYNDFLDIMKEFKSQSIDTPGVIQRVSNLFKGHPELIVGFNTFLPPGYKIEVQSNEQVNVSMPGTGAAGSAPTTVTIHPGGTPHITHNSHTSNHSIGHTGASHTTVANSSINKLTNQSVTANSQPVHSTPTQVIFNQSTTPASHVPSSNSASGSQSTSSPQASQPVEFNHAINYVNKIKNRFQGQPDIYKQFLEILHTYQKEQRNLKEGVHAAAKPLTESEVYSQVAKLFQNQEDLLQEFGQFLPDANGAASALALQPIKAVNNDHSSAIKKPVVAKPIVPSVNNQTKQLQMVKRPSSSSLAPQQIKKPRMTSLKDISLAEAGKYGTLNEYAFFDKLRKAFRSQEVYDNFLRCLVLYNQEILSRGELVHLVSPFLGKYPELFKWFKDFLGYKESSSTIEAIPNKVALQDRERITGEHAMEIDYSSCKRYGASYRALPKNYVQPKCSGRTPLCKEVLNDTWVSFPSWSEDSTFVSSRKTQYEEYIYRCEDERFELDVVLETNLATIRVLEAVQKRINRMTSEEKAQYRLDDTLGGTSTVIHQRAIRRIYGDKSPDIIEGLKRNPVVAVPLVLRRLKAKEEEWREAQKNFNKIWRDQNEKYYMKSLDHQGITFKQNDIKYLRSKTLINEIETVYEERHEQMEESVSDLQIGPHLQFTYKDKSILDDAANLIIHHVKRQTGIHKEDKQKIKHLMRQFIPDLYSVPRGDLSDDELEKDEVETEENNPSTEKGENDSTKEKFLEEKKEANEKDSASVRAGSTSSTTEGPVLNGDKNSESAEEIENVKTSAILQNSDPDDSYALFFVNNNWYLFLRLHHILCERLAKIYELSVLMAKEETRDKKDRKESTAIALRLKPKGEIEIEEYYTAFLEMVKNLLDGNMESNQYEDTLRDMFGIHAYMAFTFDKVVQNVVRQLQHIVSDETCFQCTELYLKEQANGATGGPCSSSLHWEAAEAAYQKKIEQILSDENCFKVILYKNEGKITFELLDTDVDASEDPVEVERWSEYVEKYVTGQDSATDEIREQLSKKPVFLPRNVRIWRQKAKKQTEEAEAIAGDRAAAEIIRSLCEGSFDRRRVSTEIPAPLPPPSEHEKDMPETPSDEEKSPQQLSKIIRDINLVDDTQCKFNVNSYKMVFVVHSESYLYKRMSLKRARQSHKRISQKLHERFWMWHKKWLDKHTTAEMQKTCEDWVSGVFEEEDSEFETVCITEFNTNKPPYYAYNRYRLERRDKT